jgi:hypothetical protein
MCAEGGEERDGPGTSIGPAVESRLIIKAGIHQTKGSK